MKSNYVQKNSVFAGVIGIALIALGALLICNPWGFFQSIAWILGLLIIVSGISTLVFWWSNRSFLPITSSLFLTAVVQILLGLLLLNSKFLSAIVVIALGVAIIIVGVVLLLSLIGPMIIRKSYQNSTWNDDNSIDEQ